MAGTTPRTDTSKRVPGTRRRRGHGSSRNSRARSWTAGGARASRHTHCGAPRARAAAGAVERLLPQGPCTILDIACGTGIVTERLRRPERTVVGVDRSPGMLGVAARRLPGGVVRGDATTLPCASRTVDAVVIVWLLHLLPDPAPVL